MPATATPAVTPTRPPVPAAISPSPARSSSAGSSSTRSSSAGSFSPRSSSAGPFPAGLRPGGGPAAGARQPRGRSGARPPRARDDAPAQHDQEILFQKFFKSVGPRTYAAQVKRARNGNHFLVLTEGKRDDETGDVRKTRLFVYSEDFVEFFRLIKSAAEFIRDHPLPPDVRAKRDKFWARRSSPPPSAPRQPAASTPAVRAATAPAVTAPPAGAPSAAAPSAAVKAAPPPPLPSNSGAVRGRSFGAAPAS